MKVLSKSNYLFSISSNLKCYDFTKNIRCFKRNFVPGTSKIVNDSEKNIAGGGGAIASTEQLSSPNIKKSISFIRYLQRKNNLVGLTKYTTVYTNPLNSNTQIIFTMQKRRKTLLDNNNLKENLCFYSEVKEPPKEMTRKEKLKKAVKEYGSTVIVFHVTISLISLGTCYLLVSSGIDMQRLLTMIGIEDMSAFASKSGTFVAAYAIHKVFAPARISITLASTPLIVRYLRQKGWLKKTN